MAETDLRQLQGGRGALAAAMRSVERRLRAMGGARSVDISNKWRWRESERESSFTWGDSTAGHVPAPCEAASRFGRIGKRWRGRGGLSEFPSDLIYALPLLRPTFPST
jgi:hypothetical protein